MRHYNSLTWPKNARIPISEDFNTKNISGEDTSGPHNRRLPWAVRISKPPSLKFCTWHSCRTTYYYEGPPVSLELTAETVTV